SDDGIHQLDVAHWLIGKEYPKSVISMAGKLEFHDDREGPDTEIATFGFGDMGLGYEEAHRTPYMDQVANAVRAGKGFPYWPQCSTRVEIYGTKGMMMVARHGGGWQAFTNATQQSRPGRIMAQQLGGVPDPHHKQNFVDCIRSRKRPNGDVEYG